MTMISTIKSIVQQYTMILECITTVLIKFICWKLC